MRSTYEPPQLAVLGSVRELTQGSDLTASGDSVFGIPLIGGDPDDPMAS